VRWSPAVGSGVGYSADLFASPLRLGLAALIFFFLVFPLAQMARFQVGHLFRYHSNVRPFSPVFTAFLNRVLALVWIVLSGFLCFGLSCAA